VKVRLEVTATGVSTLVQDLGRPGLTMWGVARSGAADRASLRLANRLVGNPEGVAGLECLVGGLAFVVDAGTTVAVTGARCEGNVGGARGGQDVAIRLESGQPFEIGMARTGLRVYVAVRGGIDVPQVLGSRSFDTLGTIGPPPVQPGDVLQVGSSDASAAAWLEQVPVTPPTGAASVRVVLGPRDDWFDPDAVEALFASEWQVSGDSNRIGLRLTGPALGRRAGDLPSEPVLPGAIQVPADGSPIVLGPDSGTTGGYPVIGVVLDEDLDQLGQLRPGDTVRFTR
jgi:biotin-dependent carboxylase-like uncharacterized protein